jgi:hypothetical protein
MILDCLVLYGVTMWDRRLQEEKAKVAEKEATVKETDKKATRAEKAAVRQQRKVTTRSMAKVAPVQKHHNIQQPDKSKKM